MGLRRGAPTTTTPATRHIPALDGLRALAVVAVLLYHGGVSWAPGGFLGVDVFFVLSGYLITALLLAEREASGRVALGAFWGRRARRLLPALLVVVVGVTIWFAIAPPHGVLPDVGADARWTLGYGANWHYLASGASYFDQFALPSPLLHTWSLAIEEQFYLVWPLVLLALLWFARGSYRVVLACTCAAAIVSAVLLAVWYDSADPSRVYYGTDTRATAILIGAAAALVLARQQPLVHAGKRLLLQVAATAATVGIAWSVVALDEHDDFVFRGGIPILAVLVAVVIAALVRAGDGALARGLSLRPLRAVGLISYGLYLWHWPVYVALTQDSTGMSGASLLVVRLAVTFALAGLSYELVEMPVRSGRWSGRRIWRVVPAGAVCVGVIVLVAPSAPPAITAESPAAARSAATPDAAPVRVLVVGDAEATVVGDALARVPGIVSRTAATPGCGLAAEVAATSTGTSASCAGVRNLGWQLALGRDRVDAVVVVDAWNEVVPGDGRLAWLADPGLLTAARDSFGAALEPLMQEGRSVALLAAWSSVATVGDRSFLGMDHVDRLNSLLTGTAASRRDTMQVLQPPEQDRGLPASLAAWLAPRLRAIEAGATGSAVFAMFVGDSVSMSLTPGFLRTADPAVLNVTDQSSIACGLLRGERFVETAWRETEPKCTDWPRRWGEAVAREHPDVVVMFFGAWETYDWRINGQAQRWGSAESNVFALAELEQAVQVLTATGARVVLLTSPHFVPRQAINVSGEWRNRYDPARIDAWNELLPQLVARHPHQVTLLDLRGFQAQLGDEDGLRVDGVHYTPEGADVISRWLIQRLVATANRSDAAVNPS